jgi:hypothetical protein
LTFWAKYCNHDNHSGNDGDIVSEPVAVTVKTTVVSNAEELKAIANSNKAYVLGADIDLSGETNWKPIEGFTGILSGGGHKIVNLTIDSVNDSNLGLFATLQGTVRDLTIENAKISSRGDAGIAGIVAGTNKGTVSGVTVEGNISSEYYYNVGGVVGYNDCGVIIDCVNRATVTGFGNVGGIAGQMVVNRDDAITGCKNEGIVTGSIDVGGIAGSVRTRNEVSRSQTRNRYAGGLGICHAIGMNNFFMPPQPCQTSPDRTLLGEIDAVRVICHRGGPANASVNALADGITHLRPTPSAARLPRSGRKCHLRIGRQFVFTRTRITGSIACLVICDDQPAIPRRIGKAQYNRS